MTDHEFGRIADDGTVYVRRPEGEEVAVGQWAAGDPQAGLAFFVRRYEGLRTEGDLLLTRLREGKATPESVTSVATKLREAVANPNSLGNLAALTALAESLDAAGSERRAQVSAEKEAAKERVLEQRRALTAQAEALADSTQWKSTGEAFKTLQDQWSALAKGDRASREIEQDLWKRFSAARGTFDRARRAHFTLLDATRKEAHAAKESLIARAQELSTSTDWAETSRAYRALMDQWKAAPRGPRTDEDKMWTRFRAAQDAFFSQRTAADSQRDGTERANLAAKEVLATEAEALLPITDIAAARVTLRKIGEKWNGIGHVPRNERDRVENRLRKVEEAAQRFEADKWRRTDPAKRALAESTVGTFRQSLAKLKVSAEGALASGNERKAADMLARINQTEALLAAAERSLAEYSSS